ncbi:hypothetical protein ScPMuIL_005025 [Solemya velum]
MFLVVTISALVCWVGAAPTAHTPCCWASQYEASYTEVGLSVDHVVHTFHYDYPGKRATFTSDNRLPNGTVIHTVSISHFGTGKSYAIRSNGCVVSTMNTTDMPMDHCIPSNATRTGQEVIGTDPNTKTVSTWHWDVFGGSMSRFVTIIDGCIPLQIGVNGRSQFGARSESYLITNYRTGIADTSVFDAPADCSSVPIGK